MITGGLAKMGMNQIKQSDLAQLDAVRSLSTILLFVGAFSIIVSLFGLVGAKFLNKFFLSIYLMIVIVMFLTHGVLFVVLASNSSLVERVYKQELKEAVDNLNGNKTSNNYTISCELMKAISTYADCCGYDAPNDIKDTKVIEECCIRTNLTDGCSQKPIDKLRKQARNLITIPTSIILAIEFLAILFVPFLIGRKRSDYESI